MKKILSLFFAPMAIFSLGQWNNDYEINTLVAEGQTEDIQSIGTNDGKTWIIFWDQTDGYVLRVQLLDADGNRMLGENGILANSVANNSSWTATRSQTVDGDGNLIIGFTATGDGNGYVNKFSQDGEQVFGDAGINLGGAWNLNLAASNDGSLFVGWEDGSNGQTKVMKYDETGAPQWGSPVVMSSPDSSKPFTGMGEMSVLSDNSVIVLFSTKATSWTVDAIRWAQRLSADGTPMWVAPVQVSNQTVRSNRFYRIINQNDVTFFGYYGSTGFRFDSFLQRIEADGSLPWGANGADFSTDDAYYEMETSIAHAEDSSFIWAATNLTNSNQSLYGLAVQKFDMETGERLLDDASKIIFEVNSNSWIHVGDLQLAGNKPLILFSNGISNGVNSIQLGVTLLDEDGEFKWEDEYQWIATSNNNKSRYDFTKNVDGQSVAVWAESRNGSSHAYAQNIVVEDLPMTTVDQNPSVIKIYPNPTSGILNIQSEKPLSSVEVIGLNAQVLNKAKGVNSIDIQNLPAGTYLIKLKTKDGKVITRKVIKR